MRPDLLFGTTGSTYNLWHLTLITAPLLHHTSVEFCTVIVGELIKDLVQIVSHAPGSESNHIYRHTGYQFQIYQFCRLATHWLQSEMLWVFVFHLTYPIWNTREYLYIVIQFEIWIITSITPLYLKKEKNNTQSWSAHVRLILCRAAI